jgi:hypothetical protein
MDIMGIIRCIGERENFVPIFINENFINKNIDIIFLKDQSSNLQPYEKMI